jgi:hypothetical protein
MTAETTRIHQSLAGCQQSSRGCARYVGRVGALAVALGVGMAIATGGGLGIAHADETGPPPDTSDTGGQQGEDGGSATPTTDPAPLTVESPSTDAKVRGKTSARRRPPGSADETERVRWCTDR